MKSRTYAIAMLAIVHILQLNQTTFAQDNNLQVYNRCLAGISREVHGPVREVKGFRAKKSAEFFKVENVSEQSLNLYQPGIVYRKMPGGIIERTITAHAGIRETANGKMKDVSCELRDTINKSDLPVARKNCGAALRGDHPGLLNSMALPAVGIFCGISAIVFLFYFRS